MKTLNILILLLSSINLYAQFPVIDKYGDGDYGKIANAYYKDVTGFHNQFVGTWIYVNGDTKLTVTFIPKNMYLVTTDVKNYFSDFLIGEYQYIENGVEKVNTLSKLDQTYNNRYDYDIVSISRRHKDTYPKCNECGENDYRLSMKFNEPSRRIIWGGISNNFVIRKFVENGQEKLKVQFVYTGNGLETLNNMDGEPANISTFSLPYGEYILTKQP